MNYLFGLLIFFALLLAISYGSAIVRLRRVRWRSGPAIAPCTDAGVDPHTRDLYAATAQALQALGFEPAFWYQLREPTRQDDNVLHIAVWLHPQQCTYAQIAPHPLPDAQQACTVDFLNFAADGRVLQTCNGIAHFLYAQVPGWEVQDAYLPTLAAQWQQHGLALAQHAWVAQPVDAAGFCASSNRYLDEYLHIQLQQGTMQALRDGRYRVSLRGAWKMLRQQQAAAPKLKAMLAQMPQDALQPGNAAADVLAHQRHEAMLPPSGNGAGGKLGLLLVSLIVFAVSFGVQFDLTYVAILIAVLFLHELGHLLAMAVFGFRDLQILFIPFLGAVAMGRNQHCPAWQRALIDLAGPVPGIVLALVLLYAGVADGSPFWLQVIIVLLVLNYLNLLPIHPLDGGHLVHLLLMQRWPRLQMAFWVGSVLGMFALSWWLDSPLLAGLGFLFGFALRHQVREARVLQHLRAQGISSASQEPEQLRALYAAMHDLKMPWNFATRLQSARNLLQHLSVPYPSLRESLFGLSLYVAALLGPPALMVLEAPHLLGALLPAMIADVETPDWEEQLASATSDAARISILTQAGYYHHWSGERATALQYFRQAEGLLHTLPDASAPLQASVLTGLAMALAGRDQDAAAADLEQALDYLEQAQALTDTGEDSLLLLQAQLNLRLDRIEPAFALFRQALQPLPDADPEDAYSRVQVLDEFTSALLDHHRYADTLAVLEEYAPVGEVDLPYWHARLQNKLGWAQLQLGQHTAAQDTYTDLLQQPDKKKSDGRYERADTLTHLLVVQHAEAGGGASAHSRAPEATFQQLLDELARRELSLTDYLDHLDCECERNGGYRQEQGEAMRAVVRVYGGVSAQSSPAVQH